MAIPFFDLSELARRMARMNLKPENIATQIALPPKLGAMSQPTSMPGGPIKPLDIMQNQHQQIASMGSSGRFNPEVAPPPAPMAAQLPGMGGSSGRFNPGIIAPPPPMPITQNPIPGPQMPAIAPAMSLGELIGKVPALAPSPTPSLAPAASPAVVGTAPTSPAAQPVAETSNVLGGAAGSAPDMSDNVIYSEFMSTIKQKITNPYGLAAIASTGMSESRFAPNNAFGSWNDPSQKGVNGTSGGIMSWRAERFNAMREFAKANGGDPNAPSATLQAQFLLQEDPQLIDALNAAKSPEEAQTLMNNAWRFAGYDNPSGGEAARRIALARNFAGSFGGETGAGANAGLTPMGGGPISPTSNLVGATKAETFADRLAKLGQAIEPGALGEKPKPPSGTAPPPSQGSFNRDPSSLQMIMQMLGAGGVAVPQVTATLGQLLRGGR